MLEEQEVDAKFVFKVEFSGTSNVIYILTINDSLCGWNVASICVKVAVVINIWLISWKVEA